MRVPVRLLLSAVSLSLVAFAAAPFAAGQNGAPPAGGGGMRMQMPAPKNLQVLPKDTSTEDLMKVMHGFTADLGVNCLFCHARGEGRMPNFASDENPHKDVARTMMRMVGEINQKYLASLPGDEAKATVSCGTCHQGHEVPPPFVAPPRREGPPPAAAAPTPPPAQ